MIIKRLCCLSFEQIQPLLSDYAWESYINLAWFEIWQNKEDDTLYSLSRGLEYPTFLLLDVPFDQIDKYLCRLNPFYEG